MSAEKGGVKCPACGLVWVVCLSGNGEHARRCPKCGKLWILKNRHKPQPAKPSRIKEWFKKHFWWGK